MVSLKQTYFLVVSYLSAMKPNTQMNCKDCLLMTIKPDEDVLTNTTVYVYGNFSNPVHNETTVSLLCKGTQCASVINCTENNVCAKLSVNNGSSVVGPFCLHTLEPGIITLYFESSAKDLNLVNAFADLSVGKAEWIMIFSVIAGWVYFVAWSVSFYPQIWTNFRRKSVVGLSFDFLGLNLTGFIFYGVYNICLYFVPVFQQEFHNLHPQTNIPVVLNDVVFSVHAVFAVLLTIFQCLIYDRGSQRVSLTVSGLIGFFWLGAGVLFVLAFVGTINKLTYIYCLSYAKLLITLFKYTPQAFYNYQRQSTSGWSIGNILLDFLGGALSTIQMFLTSYNYGESWSSIFTNFSKFGLGVISILFDILFIVQHYCLYPRKEKVEEPEASAIVTDAGDSADC